MSRAQRAPHLAGTELRVGEDAAKLGMEYSMYTFDDIYSSFFFFSSPHILYFNIIRIMIRMISIDIYKLKCDILHESV